MLICCLGKCLVDSGSRVRSPFSSYRTQVIQLRLYEGPVRGGEVEVFQVFRQKPADILLFSGGGDGVRVDLTTHEEQAYPLAGVVVLNRGYVGRMADMQVQFLKEFTLDALFRRFLGPDFSAGKLPFSREVRIWRPCSQQDTVASEDNSSTDVDRNHLRMPMTNSARRFLAYPFSAPAPVTTGRSSP